MYLQQTVRQKEVLSCTWAADDGVALVVSLTARTLSAEVSMHSQPLKGRERRNLAAGSSDYVFETSVMSECAG